MTDAVEHAIPVGAIVRRLENHHDELRRALDATPRWRLRRRLMLAGALGAYRYEMDEILAISGSWQPFWRKPRP